MGSLIILYNFKVYTAFNVISVSGHNYGPYYYYYNITISYITFINCIIIT